MLNGKKHTLEYNLETAFESGYSNAAVSLSKMINKKIYYNNFHKHFHNTSSILFTDPTLSMRNKDNHLITTEIFGDAVGKSYLLLSDEEFELLTIGIPQSKDPNINLKEEFLKEVDNILSASVITRLSNELKIKMYGDIPISLGKVSGGIEDIIYDDFLEQNEVYVNSIFFSFENYPLIKPVFVWVMDSSAFFERESKPAI